MLLRHTRQGESRRGVILMVVLALLTLFAILGLSFVMYSDAEATSARIFREAQTQATGDSTDISAAWAMFLGQLIYDVNDDSFGTLSAMRGHSLGRTMYGWNDTVNALNDKPYCGTGRLAETTSIPVAPAGMTRQNLPNYTYYQTDGAMADPARAGTRPGPTPTNPQTGRGPIIGDLNISYTYPDQNNMFLAMVDPTGRVQVPSYFRPWMPFGAMASTNPNWTTPSSTNPALKYMTLRPRPADNGSGPAGFPAPRGANGDVKNLDWAPGGPDSMWIDFNAPIQTLSDGTQVKVMAAPLIIDLDGRINVNSAGNILAGGTTQGKGTTHASNQGWGPWEMSLPQVLNANNTEWVNVFLGSGTTSGKYGPGGLPLGNGVPGGTPVRSYYPMDYDAVVEQNGYPLSSVWSFPNVNGTPVYQIFPNYPGNTGLNINVPSPDYANANGYQGQTTNETTNHPAIYNPMRPTGSNTNFGATDLGAMLQQVNINGNSLSSNLLRLLPSNLLGTGPTDAGAMRRRGRVTPLSFDMDWPGVTPYIFDTTASPYGQPTTPWWTLNASGAPSPGYPTGGAIAFPSVTSTTLPPSNGQREFDPNTWRSLLAALGRIDLGRQLTNYPLPSATTGQIDITSAQYTQAVTDRQKLAGDIYNVLWNVTGAAAPGSPGVTAGTAPYNTLRWLAQLAVNIVDFIDYDDYSTPFNWDTTRTTSPDAWVFGTEQPRVVINEYYAQWDNDPGSITTNATTMVTSVTGANNRINIWVELYNPFPTDPADPQNGTVWLYNTLGKYPVYQLTVVPQASANLTKIRNPDNTTGAPDQSLPGAPAPTAGNAIQTVSTWGNAAATAVITPGFQQYKGTNGSNANGFYLVGPTLVNNQYGPLPTGGNLTNANPFPSGNANPALNANPPVTPTCTDAALTYTLPAANNPTTTTPTDYRPALLLQRLANPYLPYQNTPGANYNPYITVDYVARVNLNSNLNANGNDGRVYTTTAVAANGLNPTTTTPTQRQAWGRMQPYAAYVDLKTPANSQWAGQNPTTQNTLSPQHTFFAANSKEAASAPPSTPNPTLTLPFDVQYHPDRALVSIADLLSVSGWKPHEFTQQFVSPDSITGAMVHFGHRVRWTDDVGNGSPAQASRLLRAWEFFTIKPRLNGSALMGRTPGKVNFNSVWDQAVYQALTDPQTANQFTATQVAAIWTALLASRSPDTAGTQNIPGANSQPFWGLGTGLAVAGDQLTNSLTPTIGRGVINTLLRSNNGTGAWDGGQTAQGRLLEPNPAATTQPLGRFELLSKMMGNLTTRSNVFGVWVTFGFFTVSNGSTQPVQLGAEYVWPSTGTVVRHKMFAVIDRSQLQAWPTYNSSNQPMVTLQTAITVPASPIPPTPPPAPTVGAATFLTTPIQLSTNTVTNPNTQRTWTLQANASLTIEPNTDNEETVVVQPAGAGFQATFFKSHAAGAIVISRGNPGPWIQYDPTQDTSVVPYAAAIN